jgi:hypothetical protein
LETVFGLLRSAIKPDSNVDFLQLANRGSGLCEAAVMMALYPEWDRPPPTSNYLTLTSKFDHINPTSWKGNPEVRNVTPLTCWIQRWKLVEEFLPDTREGFKKLSRRCVDIFSPCGKVSGIESRGPLLSISPNHSEKSDV